MFEPRNSVNTPGECEQYVNLVKICSWRRLPRLPWLPSLEAQTPWFGSELTHNTWSWKDDLHIDRRLYFGMILASGAPAFASLQFLPRLIASQGDIDARTLHEKGLLAPNALRVYEHIEKYGATATSALPFPHGSRMLYMAQLQQKFLIAKHDLTGRTRGKYGYRWCLCEHAFPTAFEKASALKVQDARADVLNHLREFRRELTMENVSALFRWQSL
ncbi:MAG TPA: hypothetical protein VGS41_18305 [Chthonomonadales bacterium]|nr:hypothetical protein [Chthonomonadales bacterium]